MKEKWIIVKDTICRDRAFLLLTPCTVNEHSLVDEHALVAEEGWEHGQDLGMITVIETPFAKGHASLITIPLQLAPRDTHFHDDWQRWTQAHSAYHLMTRTMFCIAYKLAQIFFKERSNYWECIPDVVDLEDVFFNEMKSHLSNIVHEED
eukprot:GILJ01020142.1.p1 GENE.GILJ01020142.1~~GILJ01020142.1.p1  ORF type:complete len:150 (+),score=13.50 GILJ01020142.1:441-890(+)